MTTINLLFPGDVEWTDVSSFIRHESQKVHLQLMNEERQSVIDSYSFALKYNATINQKFYSAETKILAQVLWDGNPKFTGYIPHALKQAKTEIVKDLSLEILDNSWLLDEDVSDSFQWPEAVDGLPYKILDSSDTSHSIIHKILEMAGYSLSTIIASGCPDILDTVTMISGTKGEGTYRSFLDTLLSEYGYSFTFTAAGQFTVYKWDKDVVTPITTINGQLGTENGIEIEKEEREYDGYKVEWAETAIEENALLYRANLPTSTYASGDSYFSGKDIAAGDYYPTDGDIEDTYQDFTTEWLDVAYLSRESLKKNKDLSLIGTSNHVTAIDADDDVEVVLQAFESKRAKVLFQNTAAESQKIYTFEILGKALYRETRHYVTVPEDAAHPEEYTSVHVYGEARAERLATARYRLLKFGDFKYSFQTRRADCEMEPGDIVQLVQSDPAIDTTVVILEKTEDPDTPMISYYAQGITEYAASTSKKTSTQITPAFQASESIQIKILEKIDKGYTAGSGGIETPTTPVLIALGAFEYNKLTCDKQSNLRWLQTYRWRTTDDPDSLTDPESVTWYAPRFDGVDWKDAGASNPYYEWPLEQLNHTNISSVDLAYLCTITNGSAVVTLDDTSKLDTGDTVTGTGIPSETVISSIDSSTQITLSSNATASGTPDLTFGGGSKKMGRRLFYQVRRRTVQGDLSDWSDVAEATTTLVKGVSVGIHELDVNNMKTGFLQAAFAEVDTIYAGIRGTGTWDNPDEGDTALVISNGVLSQTEYIAGGWSAVNKITFGVVVGATVLAFVGCRGIIHPDANTDDLLNLIPSNNFCYLNCEGDLENQNGDLPDNVGPGISITTSWYKHGSSSAYNTTTDTLQAINWLDRIGTLDSLSAAGYAKIEGTFEDSYTYNLLYSVYYVGSDFINIGIYAQVDGPTNTAQLVCWVREYESGASSYLAWIDGPEIVDGGEYFLAFQFNKDDMRLRLIVNDTIYEDSVDAFTVTGASTTDYMVYYFNYDEDSNIPAGTNFRNYWDEMLFSPATECDTDFLYSYYLRDEPWNGEIAYSDILLRPAPYGVIQLDGETKIKGPVYISETEDVTLSEGSGTLVIGEKAGGNVAIDANEIQARYGSAASHLHLQDLGGDIYVGYTAGADMYLKSDVRIYDKTSGNILLKSSRSTYALEVSSPTEGWPAIFKCNGGDDGYIAIGPANGNRAHIYTDRDYFIFNKMITVYSSPAKFSSYGASDTVIATNNGGSEFIRCDHSTGFVGIKQTTPQAQLHVNGSVRVDIPSSSFTANVGIATSPLNHLYRLTSSRKYKHSIEDLEQQYIDNILKIRFVWYRSTCKEMDPPDYSWYGVIAEELAEIDPRLVTWLDGKPDGVDYMRIGLLGAAKVQDHERRIVDLENKLKEIA